MWNRKSRAAQHEFILENLVLLKVEVLDLVQSQMVRHVRNPVMLRKYFKKMGSQ